MAKLVTIFDDDVPSFEHLDALLTALHKSNNITASQYRAAKDFVRDVIPGRLVVQQRTLKSVTLFKVGETQIRITNRAHAYVEAVIS